MVTPTYYVTFTSTTIITSALFYQGFNATVTAIITVCLGFLVICGGVLLLQTSKPVVPLHMPGSSAASIIGTISYDDIEPTAADMRASPFSSIRRITRDLRQPSIISTVGVGGVGAVGNHSVFQSSPLNPRAESLMQRKRAASNAALRSRPQSIIGGHHLAVPGAGSVAGGATAFYPSTTGAYSTIVMGPNGSQIRLQLCEIVVSDDKHETSRYQVYRPVPPHGDHTTTTTTASHSPNEKSGGDHIHYQQQQLRPRANSTGFKHPFLAPRGSLLTDSRSSSIRFSDNPTRSSIDESISEKDEQHSSTPSSPKHSSPISGSLFTPPKLAVSPPTPDLSANTTAMFSSPSSGEVTDPNSASQPAGAGGVASKPPISGPMVVGGSFFTRPKFRSPSTASGDIMEMNDPGHAGRSVVVTIEPVQQQPLFSLYVPPPPPTAPHHLHQTPKPTLSIVNSTSFTSTTSNASDASHVGHGHQKEGSSRPSDITTAADGVDSHEADDDKGNDDGGKDDRSASTLPAVTADQSTTSSKPKRVGFFGKLFSKSPPKQTTAATTQDTTATGLDPECGSGSVSASGSEDPLSTAPDSPTTSATPLVGSSGGASVAASPSSAHPNVFNRTNHPTRISEGDEEEEEEEQEVNVPSRI
ncbi:hypothetical protein BGZ96_004462 [Linnemannia gamsii]|uniref:Membrane-associated protein n=1 Tax=Linnemannia gamsii TaxID=64522 RepID=A0ABQ7JI45_9FUNG|nr:hypothetical protein BGZ96_004462 [Linnemannia gamsii]